MQLEVHDITKEAKEYQQSQTSKWDDLYFTSGPKSSRSKRSGGPCEFSQAPIFGLASQKSTDFKEAHGVTIAIKTCFKQYQVKENDLNTSFLLNIWNLRYIHPFQTRCQDGCLHHATAKHGIKSLNGSTQASHIYIATEATFKYMIGWRFYMLQTKNGHLLIAKLWRSFAGDATKENYGAASTTIKSKSSCDAWCHEIHHQKLPQEVPCSETPKRQFQPWCCRLLDPQKSVSCRSGFAKFFLGKKDVPFYEGLIREFQFKFVTHIWGR